MSFHRWLQTEKTPWAPFWAWLAWVIVQTLAVLLLLGLLTALLWLPGVQAKDVVGPFLLLSLPFGLGAAQGLVLREKSFQGWMWTLIHAAAWPLSYLLFFLALWILPETLLEWLIPVGGFPFIGLITGLWQWLFLRRRFRWAGVWVPAVWAGWAVLGWVTGQQFVSFWDFLWIGLIPALFSGAALAWMWNRTIP